MMQLAPRIGFNWDITGDQVNQLRGGTGALPEPRHVWLSNLYGNSGVNGYGNLVCNGTAAPAMQNATGALAGNCKNSTAAPAVTVNTVDPNLKFTEVWRSSIGFDRRLPWNVIGTIEGMYTRSIYNFYYQNIGLQDNPIGTDRNGRSLYGDIATLTSNPAPVRKQFRIQPGGDAGDVIAISNTKTHDYAYNITGQLVKRFSNNFEGQLAYTYGRSYNVGSDVLGRLLQLVVRPLVLGPPGCAGSVSVQVGHAACLAAGATYTFPTHTGVSLSWIGESGVPFEYVYNGDMNGDNSTANDLVYVPKNAHDTTEIRFVANGSITPAAQQDSLENFINGHSCLNSQRGTIMKRNSCRAPWDKGREPPRPGSPSRRSADRTSLFNSTFSTS
jgi:hypothetical protein